MTNPLETLYVARAFILDTVSGDCLPMPEFSNTQTNAYLWEEGNYACDCNRALFWARASNTPEVDMACDDTLRWRVAFLDQFGRLLFSDMPENWQFPTTPLAS